jgi:hypothetical protein
MGLEYIACCPERDNEREAAPSFAERTSTAWSNTSRRRLISAGFQHTIAWVNSMTSFFQKKVNL